LSSRAISRANLCTPVCKGWLFAGDGARPLQFCKTGFKSLTVQAKEVLQENCTSACACNS
jgi:hypothetical protein